LLFSQLVQLQQIALFLVAGVAWCSMVSMPLLVPALMSELSRRGLDQWWPAEAPPPCYFEDQDPNKLTRAQIAGARRKGLLEECNREV
jgi:uncharacterized membrane protein YdfJ with MMPL/SSD domain